MNYQNRNDVKSFVQLCFWIFALLLLVATKSVLGITAPTSVLEGELLTILFDDANGELHREGVLVATSSPYNWQTTPADAGLYEFKHYINGSLVETTTVEVIDVPLSFTIITPQTGEYPTENLAVEVHTESAVDFCYTSVNGDTNTLTAETPTRHTGNLTLVDGIYTADIKCKLGTELAEQQVTLLIDTTPPTIISSNPGTGETIIADVAELSLVTNEVSTCTYPGGVFTSTDFLTHTTSVTTFGANTYTATCTDIHGNAVNHEFQFTLDTLPTIEIELFSEEEVLTQGSYEIEITSTKPIEDLALHFAYQGESSNTVAVEADGDVWSGYLIIGDEGEQVGSFTATFTDLSGNVGTKITEGKLFLVDTDAPTPISTLTVNPLTTRIHVSWQDDQDDVTYKIYRANIPAVTTSNFLVETASKTYEDTSTEADTPYYYAVLAVDDAGNEGPLSAAVGAQRDPAADATQPIGSEGQVYDAQQLSQRVEQAIIDLDATYSWLESEKDEKKLVFIKELGLLEQLVQEKAKLSAALTELETLPGTTTDQFQERMAQIHQELGETNTLLPSRIDLNSNIVFQQPHDVSVQNLLFESATSLFNIIDRESYRNNMERVMDDADITGEVITIKITYTDRSEEQFTYVKTDITFATQTQETSLFVYVPKELAQDADDLFFTPQPLVVEQDPILQFNIPAGQNRFSHSFLLKEDRDLATARSVRSVLFPLPSKEAPLAGYVVAGPSDYWKFLTGNTLYLFAGLIIVVMLFYYFTIDSGPTKGDAFFAALTNKLDLIGAHPTQSIPQITAPTSLYISPQQFFKRKNIGRPLSGRRIPSKSSSESIAPELQELSSLIMNGHSAIDNKEYIDARNAYQQIYNQLSEATTAETADANLLYKKLLLYKEMQAAVTAANNNDLQSLRGKLDSLASIAQLLPETDTMLISSAKDTYRDLKRMANRFAIDQEVF